MKRVSVPSRLWYENEEKELNFPDRWDVDNLSSSGFEKPGLSEGEIKEKIENPIEGPTLEDIATPVKDVAPHILESLHKAGMKKDQIRFIWALGSHGPYDMINARKKLGDEIVENYAVYNHDAFQNTVWAGRTPTGVELWFNREFMDCDLKIGIGCITAHVHVGFGGGAKLILPGVAGIETINQFHNQMFRDPVRTGLGKFDDNIMRAECDAAGDMVGLDFKVDCLLNRRGEITDLYAGPFRATHAAGAEEGKDHYGIPHATGYDVAVCNSYGKANESAIALLLSLTVLKPGGEGTAVLIADAPEGQVPHYVMRAWGTGYGGRHYQPRDLGFVSLLMKKLIVFNPQPDRTMLDLVCHYDDATVVKTWNEVLSLLKKDYPGDAKVAVIQDGTMQYIKMPE
jgi:nickel-dependent lactate racemase